MDCLLLPVDDRLRERELTITVVTRMVSIAAWRPFIYLTCILKYETNWLDICGYVVSPD